MSHPATLWRINSLIVVYPIAIICCLFASIEIAIRNTAFMSLAVCDEMEEIRTIYEVVTKLNVLNLKESDVLRWSFWDDVLSTFSC